MTRPVKEPRGNPVGSEVDQPYLDTEQARAAELVHRVAARAEARRAAREQEGTE